MQLYALVISVLSLALACVAVSAIDDSKIADQQKDPRIRKLSFESYENVPAKRQRVKRSTSDEALQTNPLGEGNNNKISELLHFIHRKSNDATFKKADQTNPTDKQADTTEPDYSRMSDQEILDSFCNGRSFANLCERVIRSALRRNPQDVAKITQAIREKPAHVDAKKLLALKLLETGIVKAEAKGYDKALDRVINIVAHRNPYAYGVVKSIDLARKLT